MSLLANTYESRAMDSVQAYVHVRRFTPIALIAIASIFLSSRPIHDVTFINIIECGYHARAALNFLCALFVRLLFEERFYSNNYGMQREQSCTVY